MQTSLKITILNLVFAMGLLACSQPKETFETKPEENDSLSTVIKDTVETTQNNLQNQYHKIFPEPQKAKMDDKERVIQEMLSIIPEMTQLKNEIDSLSDGKNKLIFTTIEKPTAENPLFYIKAEEQTPKETITKFQFYVNSQNLQIKIYDPTEDLLIDLSTWQKNGGN